MGERTIMAERSRWCSCLSEPHLFPASRVYARSVFPDHCPRHGLGVPKSWAVLGKALRFAATLQRHRERIRFDRACLQSFTVAMFVFFDVGFLLFVQYPFSSLVFLLPLSLCRSLECLDVNFPSCVCFRRLPRLQNVLWALQHNNARVPLHQMTASAVGNTPEKDLDVVKEGVLRGVMHADEHMFEFKVNYMLHARLLLTVAILGVVLPHVLRTAVERVVLYSRLLHSVIWVLVMG